MGDGFGHEKYKPYEGLHNSVGSFDGGSCVGEHQYYYKQRDSCSYRWQAHHRATTSDKGLYGAVGTAISAPTPGQAATLRRNRALASAPGPVTTSAAGKKYRLVTGLPFRTAFAPWANNAHHLLPDAQLRGGIFDICEGLPQVEDLVVQGLLKSKYNLNHWKNMLILPQSKKIGCQLGLPTHPQGDSHPAYSAKVRGGVDSALAPYKSVVTQIKAGKPHDNPDPVDIKAALEALSMALHGSVIGLKPLILAKCGTGDDISVGAMTPSISTTPGV